MVVTEVEGSRTKTVNGVKERFGRGPRGGAQVMCSAPMADPGGRGMVEVVTSLRQGARGQEGAPACSPGARAAREARSDGHGRRGRGDEVVAARPWKRAAGEMRPEEEAANRRAAE